MTQKIVLSERKTKAAAMMAGITLESINTKAGLGVGYISRKWNSDAVQLATINRVAEIIGCSALDLIEPADEPAGYAPVPASATAPARAQQRRSLAPPTASATARQHQRDALAPPADAQMLPTDPTLTPAEAERREALLRQAATGRRTGSVIT